MQSIGSLPYPPSKDGLGQSIAHAVSFDGSVIVGEAQTHLMERTYDNGYEAFIWDEADGMRSLTQVLVDNFGLGQELRGWTLSNASSVSDDGTVITGWGVDPQGEVEAWIAVVPEPGFGLLLLGIAPLLLRRRK